jgi:hypothetical protein
MWMARIAHGSKRQETGHSRVASLLDGVQNSYQLVGLGYDETEGAKIMRSYFQGTQADTVKRIAKAVGILAEKKQ